MPSIFGNVVFQTSNGSFHSGNFYNVFPKENRKGYHDSGASHAAFIVNTFNGVCCKPRPGWNNFIASL
ncbi:MULTISPECIES: spore germination protein [Bacillus]|uniref:spore germination protein n=1 Tax=Bacillus TaxID=1386 RepID=UPI000F89EE96|nr:spore germination protein [Bacillus thuringiensis]AZR79870.1 hypothetical protein BtSCAC15_28115 [Bacillus thuringiensis]